MEVLFQRAIHSFDYPCSGTPYCSCPQSEIQAHSIAALVAPVNYKDYGLIKTLTSIASRNHLGWIVTPPAATANDAPTVRGRQRCVAQARACEALLSRNRKKKLQQLGCRRHFSGHDRPCAAPGPLRPSGLVHNHGAPHSRDQSDRPDRRRLCIPLLAGASRGGEHRPAASTVTATAPVLGAHVC